MAVYALSDLHGYLDLYKQIKEFLKPEDKVYFLGDAGDRGPQSWETIKAILYDEQFVYIKGNHDEMLIISALHYWGEEHDSYGFYHDLIANGGRDTWKDFLIDPKSKEIIYKLRDCPEEKIYYSIDKEIHLSHAGFTPGKEKKHLTWNRKHLYDIVGDNVPDNYLVVHGHTPVYYMHNAKTYEDCQKWIKPEFYGEGHKINIDMGTYNNGACCLLNLDTLKYHIFTTKV